MKDAPTVEQKGTEPTQSQTHEEPEYQEQSFLPLLQLESVLGTTELLHKREPGWRGAPQP